MKRRDFLISGLASLGLPSLGFPPVEPVDTNERNNDQTNVTLRIAPISLEIGPGKTIKTVGYNGSAPGPILRFREGKPVTIDVSTRRTSPRRCTGMGNLFLQRWMDRSKKERLRYPPRAIAAIASRLNPPGRAGITRTRWRTRI